MPANPIPFTALSPMPLRLTGYSANQIVGVAWRCPYCYDHIPYHMEWRVDAAVPQGYEDSQLIIGEARGRIEGLALARDAASGEWRLDWSGVTLAPAAPGGASSALSSSGCGAHYWIRDGFVVWA